MPTKQNINGIESTITGFWRDTKQKCHNRGRRLLLKADSAGTHLGFSLIERSQTWHPHTHSTDTHTSMHQSQHEACCQLQREEVICVGRVWVCHQFWLGNVSEQAPTIGWRSPAECGFLENVYIPTNECEETQLTSCSKTTQHIRPMRYESAVQIEESFNNFGSSHPGYTLLDLLPYLTFTL